MFKARPTTAKVRPVDLLVSHQRLTVAGFPILSLIVAAQGLGRKVWGQYCQATGLSPRVAPHSDATVLPDVFRFAGRPFSRKIAAVGILAIPETESIELLRHFLNFRKANPRHQIGIVIRHSFARELLADTSNPGLISELLNGLISLEEPVPPSGKDSSNTVLYRSPHEEILHKLMEETPKFRSKFRPNIHRRGASGLSYEIDLFSEDWSIAVEVDGIDHERNRAQRERDERRDADLAEAGIKTLRIKASAIVTNPTNVLSLLAQKLPND